MGQLGPLPARRESAGEPPSECHDVDSGVPVGLGWDLATSSRLAGRAAGLRLLLHFTRQRARRGLLSYVILNVLETTLQTLWTRVTRYSDVTSLNWSRRSWSIRYQVIPRWNLVIVVLLVFSNPYFLCNGKTKITFQFSKHYYFINKLINLSVTVISYFTAPAIKLKIQDSL